MWCVVHDIPVIVTVLLVWALIGTIIIMVGINKNNNDSNPVNNNDSNEQ